MSAKLCLSILLVTALIFRIFLIPVARHGDLNNNTSWGQLLLERGPVDFYEGKLWTYSAPNQPPLYIATFAFTAFVQNSTNSFLHWANSHIPVFPSKTIWWFDSFGELYIAKLPGILADIAIGAFIYFVIKGKKGLVLAAVWLVNPVSWYNSAIWGGTDSIVNVLGLLSIYFLYKKDLIKSAIFFALSFMFKGSLLVFAPLFLLYAFKLHQPITVWIRALFFSALVFLVVALPFHPRPDIFVWFFRLYTERFLPGEIGTLTANAFNMWWVVNPGAVLDNALFGGVSARTIGLVITAFCAIILMWKSYRSKFDIPLWLSFGLLSFASFLFMTRIHERYLYPFFPLATITLTFFPWLWIPYSILSISHLLNLYNLFWAPGIPSFEALYSNTTFELVLSITNIVIFILVLVLYLFSTKHLARGKKA